MCLVKEGIRNKKENGYLTCPFDMMVSNYQGIVDCFNDDFKYFCDDNFLELKEFHGENMIYHKRYNFLFSKRLNLFRNVFFLENLFYDFFLFTIKLSCLLKKFLLRECILTKQKHQFFK